jgi:hypothetical protein
MWRIDSSMEHILDLHKRAQASIARRRLIAFTDILEVIAYWRDQISARLNGVEPITDIEDEVRTFCCFCDALGDFLERRKAA